MRAIVGAIVFGSGFMVYSSILPTDMRMIAGGVVMLTVRVPAQRRVSAR